MWSFLVFLILSPIFSLKILKNLHVSFYVNYIMKKILKILFPNQIFQNYDFGLLINIYLYKVKIYPPFVFDLVSEHDKSNLMFSQWSRCCPLMRWLPVIQIWLTFAIFLPFEAMLCIQYKFSLIPKNAFCFTIDVLRGEVGLRSAACAGNDLAIRAVSQNLPSGQRNSSYSETERKS